MRDALIAWQPVFQLVTLAAGIFFLLQAFGALRVSRDPAVQERWRRERAGTMKVASIAMVLASLVGLGTRLL